LDEVGTTKIHDITLLVANAVQHLAQIPLPQSAPGPFRYGALAQGYLLSNDGAEIPFNSMKDMENRMNRRLRRQKLKEVNLQDLKLTLRHMDLCR
jgi:hypothetical protein